MSGERAEGQEDGGELAFGKATVATDFAVEGDYTGSHKGVTGTEGVPGSGSASQYCGGFPAADGNQFPGGLLRRLEA